MKVIATCFFSLLSANHAYSQTSEWTWVNGDSTSDITAVYGSRGIPSPTNKPGARTYSVTWKDASGMVWLFGGIGRTATTYGRLNDLWKYNPGTNIWTWMKGDSTINHAAVYGSKGVAAPANKPSSRIYAAGWADAAGNLWLFGGYGNTMSSSNSQNDLWKYNPAINQWAWISGDSTIGSPGSYGIKGIASTGNKPSARSTAVTWTDADNNLWLFGGYQLQGPLNDLWKYNINTTEWTWVNGDSVNNSKGVYNIKSVASPLNVPGARRLGVGWKDAAGSFWIFGGIGIDGRNHEGNLNDLWRYDPVSNLWTWMKGDSIRNRIGNYGTMGTPSATSKPGSRYSSAAWTDAANNLWLFGGTGYDEMGAIPFYLGDLWKYIPSLNKWVWIKGANSIGAAGEYGTMGIPSPTNQPGARDANGYWTDAAGNLWLLGGEGQTHSMRGKLNDLWRYTPGAVVPLHLVAFSGRLIDLTPAPLQRRGVTVRLQWVSENEEGFNGYEVERSSDGRQWLKVKSEQSKGGSGKNDYGCDDDVSGLRFEVGRLYYKLKMVDNDGKYSYSNVVEIKLPVNSGFSIYPNPASTNVRLQFDTSVNGKADVVVTDMSGKVVVSSELSVVSGIAKLSTTRLTAGSYVVKVMAGGEVYNEKLVIVK